MEKEVAKVVAAITAQGCLLRALAQTHPDPAAVLKSYQDRIAALQAGMEPGMKIWEPFQAAFRQLAAEIQGWIPGG